ncbi:MAG: hypothetical protein JW709_12590 [Sedimentisphaerales bacterium]|nr:hypothetical protein [Sedimentisphaerales bacterium]
MVIPQNGYGNETQQVNQSLSDSISSYIAPMRLTGREDEFCRRAHQVMLKGARFTRNLYHDWSAEPHCGYIGWGGHGEKEISNNFGFACLYAILLRFGEYDAQITGISREEMTRRVIGVIRYGGFTHLTGSHNCTDDKPWGGGWHDASWGATYALTVWLMWDELDEETRELAARTITTEIERFVEADPPSRKIDNTSAESNAWNTRMLAIATVMFPTHPQAQLWRDAMNGWGMNVLTINEDQRDTTLIEGRPVKDRVRTENINSDFTLENHGIVYPVYMWCSMYHLAQAGLFYKLAGQDIPKTLLHHMTDVYEVYKELQTWEGLPAYINGCDKFLHLQVVDIFHHSYFAQALQDKEAAYLEELELGLLEQMQNRFSDGRLYPVQEVGEWSRVANLGSFLGCSYLLHYITAAPTKAVSQDEFEKRISGVRYYPDGKFILQRTPEKLVSFAWAKPYRVMGLVIPRKGGSWLVTPFEQSLTGCVIEEGVEQEPDIKVVRADKRVQNNIMNLTIVLHRCEGKVEHAITLTSDEDAKVAIEETMKALAPVTLRKVQTGYIGVGRQFLRDEVVLKSNNKSVTIAGFSDMEDRYYDFPDNTVVVDNCFIYSWSGEGTVKYRKYNRVFSGSGKNAGAYGRVDDRIYVEHIDRLTDYQTGDTIAQGQLRLTLCR